MKIDIESKVENQIPRSLHLRDVYKRPRLGEVVRVNSQMVRKIKHVEGVGEIVYWEPEELLNPVRGFYSGHRFMQFGILKPELVQHIEYHGGTSVALVTYSERRTPMFVPWDEIAEIDDIQ